MGSDLATPHSKKEMEPSLESHPVFPRPQGCFLIIFTAAHRKRLLWSLREDMTRLQLTTSRFSRVHFASATEIITN